MANWNRTADEYQQERDEQSNEIWIKGFRDGETKVRFLATPGQFTPYLEHYDEGFGYFPCDETNECVGCKDDNAKVRERSRRFAVNALDARGQLQVFKAGVKLHRSLKNKEARLAAGDPPIAFLDLDFTVIRSGKKFNEIDWDVEWGQPYKTDFDPKTEPLYDIGTILEAKYADAVEAYTGTRPPGAAEPVERFDRRGADPEQNGSGETKSTKSNGGTKAKAKDEPKEQAKNGDKPSSDEVQSEIPSGSYPNPEDMTIIELKEYLAKPPKGNPVEHPAGAPRSRLVKLVKQWQQDNPPF